MESIEFGMYHYNAAWRWPQDSCLQDLNDEIVRRNRTGFSPYVTCGKQEPIVVKWLRTAYDK